MDVKISNHGFKCHLQRRAFILPRTVRYWQQPEPASLLSLEWVLTRGQRQDQHVVELPAVALLGSRRLRLLQAARRAARRGGQLHGVAAVQASARAQPPRPPGRSGTRRVVLDTKHTG